MTDRYLQNITASVVIGYVADSIGVHDSTYYNPNTDEIDTASEITWGPRQPVRYEQPVFDDFAVSTDIDAMASPWLAVCGMGQQFDFNHCCANIRVSNNTRDFTLVVSGDEAQDWAGATDGMEPDPADCSRFVCDTATNYIAINVTNDFLTQGTGTITTVPYTGAYEPPVINADGTRAVNVISVRTVMLHEWGHWLGFPLESQQSGLGCLPTTPDVMAPGDESSLNQSPVNLSTWDRCWFKLLYCCDVSDVNAGSVPIEPLMLGNAPNPFSNETTISYSVACRRHVMLNVYDAKGGLVKILENGVVDGGTHSVVFDGSALPIGVYHYVLFDGSRKLTKSMIFVR